MTKEQYKRAYSEYRDMRNTARYHNDEFLLETAELYNPENPANHQGIFHEWFCDYMREQVL